MILFVWKGWNNLHEQANAMISEDPLPLSPSKTNNEQTAETTLKYLFSVNFFYITDN